MNNVIDEITLDTSSLPADISNTANISFGARDNGTQPYEGLIDEINIFDHVLSVSEIDFLFNSSGGILRNWWRKRGRRFTTPRRRY